MKALNFYTTDHQGHLLCRKKSCTIRLGDKTGKYVEGDIVWITAGSRFSPRKKLFTAVIDRVFVKPLLSISEEDLTGESPDFQNQDDLLEHFKDIYKKEFKGDELVTVIYFSEIIE